MGNLLKAVTTFCWFRLRSPTLLLIFCCQAKIKCHTLFQYTMSLSLKGPRSKWTDVEPQKIELVLGEKLLFSKRSDGRFGSQLLCFEADTHTCSWSSATIQHLGLLSLIASVCELWVPPKLVENSFMTVTCRFWRFGIAQILFCCILTPRIRDSSSVTEKTG